MTENQPASNVPARYRTVRKAQTAAAAAGATSTTGTAASTSKPMAGTEQSKEAAAAEISRSRSRYRRAGKPATEPAPVMPPANTGLPNQGTAAPVKTYYPEPEFLELDALQIKSPVLASAIPLTGSPEQVRKLQGYSGGITLEDPGVHRRSLQMSSSGSDRSYARPGSQRHSTRSEIDAVPIERYITLQVGGDSKEYPICTDTTADTLKALARKFHPETALHDTATLIEKFNALGLERPIRTYERMKDVVNGWDAKTENVIQVAFAMGEQDISMVPQDPPEHLSGWLYMCSGNKPGKWSKRYIIFNNGVLKYAKKESMKEKDYSVICSLSSWDIYTIDHNTAKKTLKVPKTYSFAVKTQEKASLFAGDTPFVYYFATNDKKTYEQWRSYIYDFRSHYLHHVKGLGNPAQALGNKSSRNSFAADKPLVASATVSDRINRSTSVKKKRTGALPTAKAEEDVFVQDSLLGRTYTKRVKEMEQRDLAARQAGPGPDPLQHRGDRRSRDSSDFHFARGRPTTGGPSANPPSRHASVNRHNMPKPLLDFGNEHIPPVPGTRRQRSVTNPGNGPLINQVPSNNPFSDPPSPPRTAGLGRNKSLRRPTTRGREEEDPFIPGGLVSNIASGHGTQTYGHGIATGRDAYNPDGSFQPLLNVQNKSAFQQGSLLDRLERAGHTGQYRDDNDY